MTHRNRLWKSVPLVECYERYRLNEGRLNSPQYPELLREAEPRHIHDLVMEARTLLRRNGGHTHRFSGATVGHVAQYDTAPRGTKRLDGASVKYNPKEDEYSFTRSYDMRTSVQDTLRRYELTELALEYGDDAALAELEVENTLAESSPVDFIQRTDIFFRDAHLLDKSTVTSYWVDGSHIENLPEEFHVSDYMALGYLLEYSGLVEHK